MPTYPLHFVAWWLLFAAVPLLIALRPGEPLRRDERVYRLALVVSPLLLGVLWLHGVLFSSPSDWARIDALYLLTSWFQLHDAAFYEEQQTSLIAIATVGVSVSLLLAFRGTKAVEHAWNRRTAAISYGLQIAAWLLLRQLAGVLVKVGDALRWSPLADVLTAEARMIAVAVCVPLPVIALAFMFTRLSVERAPHRAE